MAAKTVRFRHPTGPQTFSPTQLREVFTRGTSPSQRLYMGARPVGVAARAIPWGKRGGPLAAAAAAASPLLARRAAEAAAEAATVAVAAARTSPSPAAARAATVAVAAAAEAASAPTVTRAEAAAARAVDAAAVATSPARASPFRRVAVPRRSPVAQSPQGLEDIGALFASPVAPVLPPAPVAVAPPRKAAPRKAASRKAKPRKAAPRKAKPRKAAPRKAKPRKAAPRKAKPRARKAVPRRAYPRAAPSRPSDVAGKGVFVYRILPDGRCRRTSRTAQLIYSPKNCTRHGLSAGMPIGTRNIYSVGDFQRHAKQYPSRQFVYEMLSDGRCKRISHSAITHVAASTCAKRGTTALQPRVIYQMP